MQGLVEERHGRWAATQVGSGSEDSGVSRTVSDYTQRIEIPIAFFGTYEFLGSLLEWEGEVEDEGAASGVIEPRVFIACCSEKRGEARPWIRGRSSC